MAETQILSGKVVSEAVYAGLDDRIDLLKSNHSTVPGLAAVIVGDDPASQVYVRNKTRRFSKLNLHSETIRLPEETSQEELLTTIHTLNNDPVLHIRMLMDFIRKILVAWQLENLNLSPARQRELCAFWSIFI